MDTAMFLKKTVNDQSPSLPHKTEDDEEEYDEVPLNMVKPGVYPRDEQNNEEAERTESEDYEEDDDDEIIPSAVVEPVFIKGDDSDTEEVKLLPEDDGWGTGEVTSGPMKQELSFNGLSITPAYMNAQRFPLNGIREIGSTSIIPTGPWPTAPPPTSAPNHSFPGTFQKPPPALTPISHHGSGYFAQNGSLAEMMANSSIYLARQCGGGPERMFECLICHKQLASKYGLLIHLRTHTGEQPYRCDMCPKTFNNKSNMYKHRKTHADREAYECEICHKLFSDAIKLDLHRRCHSSEQPFECELCKKRLSSRNSLYIHLRTHSGEQPYSCRICAKTFNDKSNLKRHEKAHMGLEASEFQHECDICGRRFLMRSGLAKHYRVHSGERFYSCDTCERILREKGDTSELPPSCDECGRKFTSDPETVANQQFECQICGVRFNDNCLLQTHIISHAKNKPYPCDICPKSFRNKRYMLMHRKIHDPDQPDEQEDIPDNLKQNWDVEVTLEQS